MSQDKLTLSAGFHTLKAIWVLLWDVISINIARAEIDIIGDIVQQGDIVVET
jgi:hypothetical protein